MTTNDVQALASQWCEDASEIRWSGPVLAGNLNLTFSDLAARCPELVRQDDGSIGSFPTVADADGQMLPCPASWLAPLAASVAAYSFALNSSSDADKQRADELRSRYENFFFPKKK